MRSARLLAALAGAALATGAHAQTAEWTNPDGGDWNDPANWVGGVAPGAGAVVRFDLAAAYSVLAPGYFEGRRLAVERGDLTLFSGASSPSLGLYFSESELVNPPSLLIGSLAGESASLTTDVAIGGPLTLIGAAGSGAVTTTSAWISDAIYIGGAGEATEASGAFTLIGADAQLLRAAGGSPDVTVGLVGQGRLEVLDGASVAVNLLRLAPEAGGSAEVNIEGSGSRLDIASLADIAGDAVVRVGLGAALATRSPSRSSVEAIAAGELRLEFAGGSLEGFRNIEWLGRSPGSIEMVIAEGSNLEIDESCLVDRLTVRGPGSCLTAQSLRTFSGLRIESGGSVCVAPAGGGDPYLTSAHSGDAIIRAGSFIVDDGSDQPVTRRFASGFGATPTGPDQYISITDGSDVRAEGLLVFAFAAASEIRGEGTLVRQRSQAVQAFGAPAAHEGGHLRILGLRAATSPAPPPLVIDDGARVECAYAEITATLRLGDGAMVADRSMQMIYGEIVLTDAATLAAEVLALAGNVGGGGPADPRRGVVLRGSGVVGADVSNGAVIDPGVGAAAGSLCIEGTLTQRRHARVMDSPNYTAPVPFGFAPGVLHIDLASPSDHDRLEVTGDAILGGTLEVALLGGFAPAWGDAFTVLTAGAIDGGFETLDLPEAPAGLVYEVEYTDTAATLTLARRTDITRDLVVGAEDLGALLARWGTADGRADVNGDGVVDGADLGIVLGDWGAQGGQAPSVRLRGHLPRRPGEETLTRADRGGRSSRPGPSAFR